MWDQTLQYDYTLPISFDGIIDVDDGDVHLEEINNYMKLDNLIIHSLETYFLRKLCHKGLSYSGLKQFCVVHNYKFPWLYGMIIKDTHLPFNPYLKLLEYRQAENAYKELFKQIIEKVFSDNQPLLRLDNILDNRNLFLTLVIAHVIALHASISQDSNPLAAYFHRTAACQDMLADAPIIGLIKSSD
ncbi:e3 ubiquitin-protein ligase [Gigaspora margarita]|uniref:E3 ubiquitin-protein ligase n=1 Tax=Gigaspora margarita TaxID=4874 RepID=A0A8H4A8V4_GIGMA|nr:e3 ubiquitin-protein ligase [Gigaspora margarita]